MLIFAVFCFIGFGSLSAHSIGATSNRKQQNKSDTWNRWYKVMLLLLMLAWDSVVVRQHVRRTVRTVPYVRRHAGPCGAGRWASLVDR